MRTLAIFALLFVAILALPCFAADEDEELFGLQAKWEEGTSFTCEIEENQKLEVANGEQFSYISLSERLLKLNVEIEETIDSDGGEVTAEYADDGQYTNYFYSKDEELPADRPKNQSGIVGKRLTFKRGQEQVEDPDNPGVMLTGGLQRFAKITSWAELISHDASSVGQEWKIEEPGVGSFITHNSILSQYNDEALENLSAKYDKKEITARLKSVNNNTATLEITGELAVSVDQESSGVKLNATVSFTQTVTLDLAKHRIVECVRTGTGTLEMNNQTYKSDEKVTVRYKYN